MPSSDGVDGGRASFVSQVESATFRNPAWRAPAVERFDLRSSVADLGLTVSPGFQLWKIAVGTQCWIGRVEFSSLTIKALITDD